MKLLWMLQFWHHFAICDLLVITLGVKIDEKHIFFLFLVDHYLILSCCSIFLDDISIWKYVTRKITYFEFSNGCLQSNSRSFVVKLMKICRIKWYSLLYFITYVFSLACKWVAYCIRWHRQQGPFYRLGMGCR